MDRTIIQSLQQPQSADLLKFERAALIGHAKLAADLLGSTGTLATGLAASPGTGLTVSIAAGQIYGMSAVDASAYGSLTSDSHQILKQGILLDATTLSGFPAPVIVGQSINYLIEAQFQEVDTTAVLLNYFNSANPTQYLQGQAGNGVSQYTLRQGQVHLQVKAGTAATTGSQTTPSADSGYTPLWVVEIRYGDTTPDSGRITQHASAPFLAGLLNKHHTGAPGAAPQIDLTSEVQNTLPMGHLPASDTVGKIAAMQTYGGNPNGHVAGNAASGGAPPSQCWDAVNQYVWTCTTTGTTSTAVWTAPPAAANATDTGSGLAYQIGWIQ